MSRRRFKIEFNGDAMDMLAIQWAIDAGLDAIIARRTGRDVFDRNSFFDPDRHMQVLERLRGSITEALWEDTD